MTDLEMRKLLLMIFVWDARRELGGRVYIGASLRNQVLEFDSTGLDISKEKGGLLHRNFILVLSQVPHV